MLRVSPSGLTRTLPRNAWLCLTLLVRVHATFASTAAQLKARPSLTRDPPPHQISNDFNPSVDAAGDAPGISESLGESPEMLQESLGVDVGASSRHHSTITQPSLPKSEDAGTRTGSRRETSRTSNSHLTSQSAHRHGILALEGVRANLYRRRANAYVTHLANEQAGNEHFDPVIPPTSKAYENLELAPIVEELQELPAAEVPQEYRSSEFRATLLAIIGSTNSPESAWNAYHLLTLLPRAPSMALWEDTVPRAYLNRLVRLLGKFRPRTRMVFLHLLNIIATLHRNGAKIPQWQWSLLIDAAGKGWRRLRLEDFRNALHVYADMVSGRPPAATFLRLGRAERMDNATDDVMQEYGVPINETDEDRRPDIVTFTSLLALAVKSEDQRALRRASQLLAWSGLEPNAVTHTVMFEHFVRRGDFGRARAMLSKIREHADELGQAEFNSILWTFASCGRLDVAGAMYQIVRARSVLHDKTSAEAWEAHLAQLEPDLVIPENARPDIAVYHMMIQAYAYRGHLPPCLQVFMDMLSEMANGAGQSGKTDESSERVYNPTLTAFRAIFLGFYRHGASSSVPSLNAYWTLGRLEGLFGRFLALPADIQPKQTLLFWILMAFWHTGGRDASRVQRAMRALENRFGGRWSGRLARLRDTVDGIVESEGVDGGRASPLDINSDSKI